jgi:uncharacterized protein (TIGR02996 family)
MDERANLIRAIVADRREMTPRLAFADWLQENGQPERAEFIRLQIDSLAYPAHGSEFLRAQSGEERSRARARADALLGAHWREWCYSATLPPGEESLEDWIPGQHGLHVQPIWPDCRQMFCGGFVEDIELSAGTFVEHAGAIFSAHPISNVGILDEPGRVIRDGRRWYFWDAGLAGNGRGRLPAELIQVLIALAAEYECQVVEQQRVEYPEILFADGALSRAANRFGRAAAGLPERD